MCVCTCVYVCMSSAVKIVELNSLKSFPRINAAVKLMKPNSQKKITDAVKSIKLNSKEKCSAANLIVPPLYHHELLFTSINYMEVS